MPSACCSSRSKIALISSGFFFNKVLEHFFLTKAMFVIVYRTSCRAFIYCCLREWFFNTLQPLFIQQPKEFYTYEIC